jgi:C4-dicarboxylate transporter, DctQ subunit
MLKKFENSLMAVLVVLALFLICKEVVVRYFVPQYLTDYGLEFTIYFTVWAIFLAGAPLVREGRHVRADILLHLLPAPAQRVLEILSLIIGLIFTCVLAYYGWLMVENSISLGERGESSAHFPLFLYYMALPVGMTLMIPSFLWRLYLILFRFDPATMLVTEEDVLRDK